MRVFVTDADYKHALGAVRSLGSRGIEVVAGSSVRHAQSFFSRYCRERVVYPSPSNEEAFVSFLGDYLRRKRVDVLLPIGYDCSVLASRHRSELSEHARIPIASRDRMEVAADKRRSADFARGLGIPVPRVYDSPSEVRSFPVVTKDSWGQGTVRYVNSRSELQSIAGRTTLIEEYVPGDGYGFHALLRNGEPRAIFMHRRIREFPVTGGASTAAESVFDPRLKDLGLNLLTALGWNGVAMVEFKRDRRDGEFKFMEVNPKFWGSMELAIAAGVDFPYLATEMAMRGDVSPVSGYQVGVRYHWPVPDEVLHVAARPTSLPSFLRDSFDPSVRSNVSRGDLGPNLVQVGLTAPLLMSLVVRHRLRYPHGRPGVVP